MANHRALVLARAIALFLWLLCLGCNVVVLRESRIDAALRAQGLGPTRMVAGSDVVSAWVGGAGPTIVMLHGFGASGLWQWHEQVPALAAGHRLVIPDLLWFGDSFSKVADFGIDHQVRAVRALLAHLGVRRAQVMGVSYGGLVAYELATAAPEMVSKLVIVDSPGRAYTRADYDSLRDRFHAKHVADILIPAKPDGVRRLLDLAYDAPPWTPDWVLPQIHAAFYSRHRAEQVALLDSVLGNLDALAARPDPRAPTLIVWGRNDPVFPLEIGRRLAARLGERAKLEIIEDAKHAPNVERAERFNEVAGDFLR
jgi:pimeloyl-ACP methyl ester carboxylesterase